MSDRYECPNCEAYSSKRLAVEWYTDMVEEVRGCIPCGCEYVVKFDIFGKEVTHE